MNHPMTAVEEALSALRKGRPVLVYDADGREEETDLIVPSQAVTAATVRTLRREAGGLICVTLPAPVARTLGLPRMEEALERLAPAYPVLQALAAGRPAYDARTAFSVTVNHREVRTGITDRDRARTVGELARTVREALATEDGVAQSHFAARFRAPGHVHLLIADDPLLEGRRGHTELATALLRMAGILPTATLCEMLGDNGRARSKEGAKKYARDRNLVFVEGREILEAWGEWSGSWLLASSTSST